MNVIIMVYTSYVNYCVWLDYSYYVFHFSPVHVQKDLTTPLSSAAISTTTTTTTTISSSLLHRLMIKMTLHLIQYDCDIFCGSGTGMGYYSSKTSTHHRITMLHFVYYIISSIIILHYGTVYLLFVLYERDLTQRRIFQKSASHIITLTILGRLLSSVKKVIQ